MDIKCLNDPALENAPLERFRRVELRFDAHFARRVKVWRAHMTCPRNPRGLTLNAFVKHEERP